ncbi:hypothetical protein BGZ58_008959 [Dissophora ornata]|nr:hypothetical protein BGZ58_008959 [Dissophora ornata]
MKPIIPSVTKNGPVSDGYIRGAKDPSIDLNIDKYPWGTGGYDLLYFADCAPIVFDSMAIERLLENARVIHIEILLMKTRSLSTQSGASAYLAMTPHIFDRVLRRVFYEPQRRNHAYKARRLQKITPRP